MYSYLNINEQPKPRRGSRSRRLSEKAVLMQPSMGRRVSQGFHSENPFFDEDSPSTFRLRSILKTRGMQTPMKASHSIRFRSPSVSPSIIAKLRPPKPIDGDYPLNTKKAPDRSISDLKVFYLKFDKCDCGLIRLARPGMALKTRSVNSR